LEHMSDPNGPGARTGTPCVRVIPVRDQRLGQSDRTTAAFLWLIITVAAGVVGAVALLPTVMALRAAGEHVRADLVATIGPAFAFGAVFAVLVRMIAVDHRASFARLTQRLRRSYPWVRIRLDDPPFRLLGIGLLHGRRGLVAFAPGRAVIVVQRVPTWVAALSFGVATCGGPRVDSVLGLDAAGGLLAILFLAAAAVLALLSGSDVYEIACADLDRADSGDGRVQWAQHGDAAPNLIRFRLTHTNDPGASSPWLADTPSRTSEESPLDGRLAAPRDRHRD
jgi:hypothetical protein